MCQRLLLKHVFCHLEDQLLPNQNLKALRCTPGNYMDYAKQLQHIKQYDLTFSSITYRIEQNV